jgi:RNA polymerase sigma-70 factor (ECF subfamily)
MPEPSPAKPPGREIFFTTRWTMIQRAKGDAPQARAALGDLCAAYWTPVFRFLQREGRNEDQSRELTQEFFSRILAKRDITGADPRKGRFRSYLLGALKHFLTDRQRAENALKRGGGAEVGSLDAGPSPEMQVADAAASVSDAWFDRHWALAVMDRALETVRDSFAASGKAGHFETLKPWLAGDAENLSQQQAAAALGISPGAVKVAIHRLRQKFGEAIRAEIADTVAGEDEIREELRYLIEAVGKAS